MQISYRNNGPVLGLHQNLFAVNRALRTKDRHGGRGDLLLHWGEVFLSFSGRESQVVLRRDENRGVRSSVSRGRARKTVFRDLHWGKRFSAKNGFPRSKNKTRVKILCSPLPNDVLCEFGLGVLGEFGVLCEFGYFFYTLTTPYNNGLISPSTQELDVVRT